MKLLSTVDSSTTYTMSMDNQIYNLCLFYLLVISESDLVFEIYKLIVGRVIRTKCNTN